MSTCGSEWGKGTEKLSKLRNLKKKKKKPPKHQAQNKTQASSYDKFLVCFKRGSYTVYLPASLKRTAHQKFRSVMVRHWLQDKERNRKIFPKIAGNRYKHRKTTE